MDDALFEGVHRVPPDSVTVVRPDGSSEIRETKRVVAPLELSALDAADRMWTLVLASVERETQGAKRVAVLTGGGVDSGALLTAVANLSRRREGMEVHAIALHFGGEGDDRPYMRELERHFDVIVHRISPAEAGPYMRGLLDNTSLPLWAPSAAGDLAVLHKAREIGADVVLSGTGGDDLFDGYPNLLANDFARGDVRALATARRLSLPWDSTAMARLSEFIVRPLVARAMPRFLQIHRRRKFFRERWPWAGPRLRGYAKAESVAWQRGRVDTPTDRFDRLSKTSYMADMLEYFDELATLAGVRLAHPYLSEDLLALTAALPPKLFFHGDRLRGLFRLAARGSLPEKIRLRPDKARFDLARQEMLKVAGGTASFEDLAAMSECGKLGLVEPEKFIQAFEEFPRKLISDDTAWTWLWPVLSIEGFLRARAKKAHAMDSR
ncbi:MAG: asparagine synthase-related protein [Polyangiaceae bacterium]